MTKWLPGWRCHLASGPRILPRGAVWGRKAARPHRGPWSDLDGEWGVPPMTQKTSTWLLKVINGFDSWIGQVYLQHRYHAILNETDTKRMYKGWFDGMLVRLLQTGKMRNQPWSAKPPWIVLESIVAEVKWWLPFVAGSRGSSLSHDKYLQTNPASTSKFMKACRARLAATACTCQIWRAMRRRCWVWAWVKTIPPLLQWICSHPGKVCGPSNDLIRTHRINGQVMFCLIEYGHLSRARRIQTL